MSGQTVFVQLRYCPLCQFNHKKGNKHVYSKRHQEIVTKAITKFLKKISEAREFLKKPSVMAVTWDLAGQKFWCYFCQEDVNKHRHSTAPFGSYVVQYGGLLEHITRSDHLENTTKFLKENKLDMKRTTEFIISSNVYLKYLEDVECVCSEFFVQKSQAMKQVAAQIRFQSLLRQDIVASSIREQILPQQGNKEWPHTPASGAVWSKPARDLLGPNERGKKTIQAFGEGLTAIDRLDEDDKTGNVYTNCVPPWMQPDESNEKSCAGVIGPTIDDLEKHRKLDRKRQLPACRVGAKFDHKSDQADSWLPDFGGVWNHGRRTKSGHQFLRRQSKKAGGFSHSSEAQLLDSVPPLQTSYSLPTIVRRTSTVTCSSQVLASGTPSLNDLGIASVHTDSSHSSHSVCLSSSNTSLGSHLFSDHNLGGIKVQPFTVVTTAATSSVHGISWPDSATSSVHGTSWPDSATSSVHGTSWPDSATSSVHGTSWPVSATSSVHDTLWPDSATSSVHGTSWPDSATSSVHGTSWPDYATSSVHSSSLPDSGFINKDSLVIVKPYIRKHKSVSGVVSEPGLSLGSVCPPGVPDQMVTITTGSNVIQAHCYTNMPPPFPPFENHNSLTGYDRQVFSNGLIYQGQAYAQRGSQTSVVNRELKARGRHSCRLIATPILNKDKMELPHKKSVRQDGFDK